MRVSAWTKALRFSFGKYGIESITADPDAWYVAFVHWLKPGAKRSSADARYAMYPNGTVAGHASAAAPYMSSAAGVGRFTNVALTGSSRRTVSRAFAPSRSV